MFIGITHILKSSLGVLSFFKSITGPWDKFKDRCSNVLLEDRAEIVNVSVCITKFTEYTFKYLLFLN